MSDAPQPAPPGHQRRWSIFVLAFAVADLAAIRFLIDPPYGEHGKHVLLAALVQSQIGLLSIWTALGGARLVFRCSALLGATILLAGLATWAYHDLDEMKSLAVGFFLITEAGIVVTAVFAPMAWARRPTLNGSTAANTRKPPQFSLRNLFEAITAFAVLLFLTRVVLLPMKLTATLFERLHGRRRWHLSSAP